MLKLNWKKLHEDRKQIEQSIKEMKARKRESGQPNWNRGPDDWALDGHKEKATALYALIAESRGHFHIDPERAITPYQKAARPKRREAALKQYALPEEPTQIAASS